MKAGARGALLWGLGSMGSERSGCVGLCGRQGRCRCARDHRRLLRHGRALASVSRPVKTWGRRSSSSDACGVLTANVVAANVVRPVQLL